MTTTTSVLLDPRAAPLPLDLPWYFALFILVVWLAVVYGIVQLARHRLQQRRARRDRARRIRAGDPRDVLDLESWELEPE